MPDARKESSPLPDPPFLVPSNAPAQVRLYHPQPQLIQNLMAPSYPSAELVPNSLLETDTAPELVHVPGLDFEAFRALFADMPWDAAFG